MTTPLPSDAPASPVAPAATGRVPAWLATRPVWVDLAFVVLAALVAHAGMLGGGFVYDDTLVCFADVARRPDGVLKIFSPTGYFMVGAGEAAWRPVATLTHWIDFQVAGFHPWWGRGINWLLHAGAAAMVWRTARGWGFPRFAALTGALLFAVHPLAGESVAVISFREEMLTVVGFGATIWLAMRATSSPVTLVGAGLAAFLTCGAKELGFMLPPLLAAGAVLLPPLPGEAAGESTFRRVLRWAGAPSAGAALFAVLRFVVFAPPESFDMGYVGHPGGGGLATGLTMMQIMARYAGLFLWPQSLSVDHTPVVVESLADWRAWTGLLAMVGMLAFGLHALRRSPRLAMAWLWIVFGLIPVLDIVPLANIMAERYCYLPLAGAGLAVGWGAQVWLDRRLHTGRSATLVVLLVAVVTGASMARHWARAGDWKHDAALWSAAGRANPASFRAVQMYGFVLGKVELKPEELRPAFARITDAEAALGRPIARGERYAAVRDRMQRLINEGDFENPTHRFAIDMSRKELEIELRLEAATTAPRWSPEEATNWLYLGVTYYEAGELVTNRRRPLKNKIEEYTTYMKDRQRDGLDGEPVRQQISRVVDELNTLPDPRPYLDKGEEWMLKSVETNRMPLSVRAAAYEHLSACVGLMGMSDSARSKQYAEEAIRLQPTRVYAHYNLAVHYGELARLAGPGPERDRFIASATDHYRACFDDARTQRLAFLNYVSIQMQRPEFSDPRSAASKALVDEWAVMADRIPDDIEFRKQLAIRCLVTKLNRRARDQFRKLVSLEPTWAQGWLSLAAIAEEGLTFEASAGGATDGDPKAALAVLQEGYAQAGAERMDALNDGQARAMVRRLTARVAIAELKPQVERTPTDYDLRLQLGQAYDAAGFYREAQRELRVLEGIDAGRSRRDDIAGLLAKLAAQERRDAESSRLETKGTCEELAEVARRFEARADFRQAQAWLKRALERDAAAYEALGLQPLHTRIQQALDIAASPERSAEEFAQYATQSATEGAWPYAVWMWRACRERDPEVFRRLAGPNRLAAAEAQLPKW